MAKFIGQTGLVYLWGKIKNYVANYVKIASSTGKDTITAGNNSVDIYDWAQASSKPSYNLDEITDGTTNKAFTSTEKTKLENIASGAEVNQNAFSNVKVGSSTIAADGKTDTLELAAGSNNLVSLTADTANDKVTIEIENDLSKFDNTTSGFITSADIPEGVSPYTSDPEMDGTASAGSSSLYAKGDHVHPTDTSRAPLASPTFTGTPTAPTATAGTNTTQVATTAFVTTAIQNAQTGAAMFQGTAPTTFAPTNYKKGYYWIVGTAGTYCGETCEAGDMIYAVADYNSAYSASDFNVVQRNLDIAEMTTSEMDTATSNWT